MAEESKSAPAKASNKLQTFTALLRDLVSSLRDMVIFLLFVLLLFAPTTIKDRLVAAGFTKGSIAGFEWEAQIKSVSETTKAAGVSVSQAKENYEQLVTKLKDLEQKVSDPAMQSEIQSLGQVANQSHADLTNIDDAIKRSLVSQQKFYARVDLPPPPESGWLYLGVVNQDKSAWSIRAPEVEGKVNPLVSVGEDLHLGDNAYLRGDAEPGRFNLAPVLGVRARGELLEVTQVNYAPARIGGWVVWVKVRPAA